MRRCIGWPIGLCVMSVFAGSQARAAGFLIDEYGGEQGHPTTDDLTAMYYNPAGLSLGTGTRLGVNGLFAVRKLTYDRPTSAIDRIIPAGMTATGTPADAVSANSGRASLLNFVVSPFFGIATDFGVPNLGVGVSLYVPFGGTAIWDQNTQYRGNSRYPGAVDGVQRWGVIDGTSRSFYGTLAGSYRIPQAHLSIGLGLNVIVHQTALTRARNADGSDDLVTSTGALQEGRSYLDVSGATASLSFGLIWQPIDTVWIGASYQSQPGFGENTLSGTLDNKLGVAAAETQKVELKQSLPDVLRIGVRYRPRPKIELRLHANYQRWSVFDRQCILDATDPKRSCRLLPDGSLDVNNGGSGVILAIPRNWKDAFKVHAGGSYFPLPELEVFAGVSYDASAVPDSTLEPSLVDMQKVIVDGGARIEFYRRKMAIAGTYEQLIFLDRTAPPRPRDPSGAQLSPRPPSKNPDGAGTYSQSIGLFSLSAQYRF